MNEPAQPTKVVSDFESTLDKADAKIASFEIAKPGPIQILRGILHTTPTLIPIAVLFLSILVFSLAAGDRFLTPGNMSLVLQQVTVTGIIAIAQTMIILTAGIDLSVGAIMALASIVMGKLAVQSGLPVSVAVLAGLGAGGLMGYVNGALVTYMKLPPFIATLGTLNIYQSLKLFYSHSESIRNSDIEKQAPGLLWFGDSFQFLGASVTYGGIALLVTAFVAWYALNWTAWGRHVHAVGDDPDAAMLAGIRTDKTLVSVYTVAGIICAFAAWILIGRVGSVTPLAGETANLDSITAVVIGGTSLFGGRGSIVGSVLGAIIVGIFRNGLSLAGVEVLWQDFTVGILIILAVAIDQWLRRASK